MQKIRLFLFSIFGVLGGLLIALGGLFLNKKQSTKLVLVLQELADTLEEWKVKNVSIEDKIFIEDTRLTKDMYKKGTNKDLSVECRICGENTPRGKYFVRTDSTPDSQQPYMFICKDCWNQLPEDEEDYINNYWLTSDMEE